MSQNVCITVYINLLKMYALVDHSDQNDSVLNSQLFPVFCSDKIVVSFFVLTTTS